MDGSGAFMPVLPPEWPHGEVFPLCEDDVLLVWLQGELESPRFGARLKIYLSEHGLRETLITQPRPTDSEEIQLRRQIMGFRTYEWDPELDSGFACRPRWELRWLGPEALLERARYHPFPEWLTLSGGSVWPRDTARRVLDGQIDLEHTEIFHGIARAYQQAYQDGQPLPPVILIAQADNTWQAKEGHGRLTGLALAQLQGLRLPHALPVIVGEPTVCRWPRKDK